MADYPDGLTAVMFREEVTERRAWPIGGMSVLPLVGDFVETAAVYLEESQSRAFTPDQECRLTGQIVGRRFINRGGSWVCVLTVPNHSIHQQPTAAGQGE